MMPKSLFSGTIAGVVSTIAFALIHDILISDIWFSLLPMMAAGALCGLCIAWSYHLAFARASLRTWIRFNLVYTGMFLVLAMVSLIVYDPVTTVAALVTANEAPTELILKAVPLTTTFTLVVAVLIGWLYGRTWKHRCVILLTTFVLVLTLGLNVSILGFVDIPSSAFSQVASLFVLISAIDATYATVYVTLRWTSFR